MNRFTAIILDDDKLKLTQFPLRSHYGIEAMAEANALATEYMMKKNIYEAFVILVENFDHAPPENRISFLLQWPSEITRQRG